MRAVWVPHCAVLVRDECCGCEGGWGMGVVCGEIIIIFCFFRGTSHINLRRKNQCTVTIGARSSRRNGQDGTCASAGARGVHQRLLVPAQRVLDEVRQPDRLEGNIASHRLAHGIRLRYAMLLVCYASYALSRLLATRAVCVAPGSVSSGVPAHSASVADVCALHSSESTKRSHSA